MTHTVFILCAGDARRFGGTLKQLLPIGDTTILGRQLSQLLGFDCDTFVVTHDPQIRDYAYGLGAQVLIPTQRSKTCETALSTSYRWLDRTTILLGDVIYSNRVLSKIMACSDPVMFFGDKWETYALSFDHGERATVLDALRGGFNSPFGKIRHAYRAMIGASFDRKESVETLRRDPFFSYIDCWITRDCDSPYHYERILKELVDKHILEKE